MAEKTILWDHSVQDLSFGIIFRLPSADRYPFHLANRFVKNSVFAASTNVGELIEKLLEIDEST